jgi:hypothetical protein
MLRTIAIIILVVWLLGLLIHIGGALINLLLPLAIIVVLYDFLVARRRPKA